MDLADKVAVVTGSTKGIGEGIAKEMALEGAKVVVTGRDVAGGQRVVQEIVDAGGVASFFAADVGDEDQCKALLQFAVDTYGSLTVLCNNHAPTVEIMEKQYDTFLADTETKGWDYLIHYGLTSVYYMLKHSLPLMIASGGGSIINISSLAAEVGLRGTSMYSATKGAMNAMTRNIAVDYGHQGIRANAIVVGMIASHQRIEMLYNHPSVRTEMERILCVQRVGYPSDVAHLAVYFGSDKSGYVTGQAMRVDGGLTMQVAIPSMQTAYTEMAEALNGSSRASRGGEGVAEVMPDAAPA